MGAEIDSFARLEAMQSRDANPGSTRWAGCSQAKVALPGIRKACSKP
jgi:hypothetical protein